MPPPQIIRLKRRRDEEPLDYLAISRESAPSVLSPITPAAASTSKRRFTDYHFQRLREDGSVAASTARAPGQQHRQQSLSEARKKDTTGKKASALSSTERESIIPTVPLVRTSLPGEEDVSKGPGRFVKHSATPVTSSGQLSPSKRQIRPDHFPGRSSTPRLDPKRSFNNLRSSPRKEPRKFHLAKESLSASTNLSGSFSTSNGIRKGAGALGIGNKKKGPQEGKFAVFVETRDKRAKEKADRARLVRERSMDSLRVRAERQEDATAARDGQVSRKRPGASLMERKWREENWRNGEAGLRSRSQSRRRSHSDTSNRGDVAEASDAADMNTDTLKLQEAMQRFAMEDLVTQEQQNRNTPSSSNVDSLVQLPTLRGPSLKTQPKAPPPRLRDRRSPPSQPLPSQQLPSHLADSPDLSMHISSPSSDSEAESESDFVYDTYTLHRTTIPGLSSTISSSSLTSMTTTSALNTPAPSSNLADPLKSIDAANVGLLIITEEDEERWEHFGLEGEGGDSDVELNSDDEDENAEDYYGNDYPDEEDGEDDDEEYGNVGMGRSVGARFGFRTQRSDDEGGDEEWDLTNDYAEDDAEGGVWSDGEGNGDARGIGFGRWR